MGNKTGISWTDSTWNAVSGCTRVSDACRFCYVDWAPNFRVENRHFRVECPECTGSGICVGCRNGHYCAKGDRCCPTCGGFGGVRSNEIGATTDIRLHEDRLDQPLRWSRPRRIFVNSTSDVFHEEVPSSYIAKMFAVMALASRHTFQVLTKRPARMRSLLNSKDFWAQVAYEVGALAMERKLIPESLDAMEFIDKYEPLPNVWLGVTVENQKWADIRIPILMETPAAVRFLSCEPLLGPVELTGLDWNPPSAPVADDGLTNALNGTWYPALGDASKEALCSMTDLARIDWVIAGGESGTQARPMEMSWVESLRNQCAGHDVPFFFKQAGVRLAREWGCTSRNGSDPAEWPIDLPQEFPAGR